MRIALVVAATLIARGMMFSNGVEPPRNTSFNQGMVFWVIFLAALDVIEMIKRWKKKD